MQFLRRWSLFFVIPVFLLVLIVPKWISSAADSSSGNASTQGGRPAPAVRAITIEPETLRERLILNGTLQAEDRVQLRSEISGRVTGIYFSDGSIAEEGELLVKIRDDDLQAQRRAKQTQIELAEIQLRRQQRLLESESTTQEAFDEARIRRRTLEAELELIDAQIAKTEIRAPFSGRIGLRQISVGTLLEPNTVVTSIQDVRKLKVDVAVPERHMPRVHEGMAIDLRVDGVDRPYRGEVVAIDPQINVNTRTLTLRAEIDNTEGNLRPGGFATIELVLSEIEDAMMIPATAVIPDLDRTTVYVLQEDRAIAREVRTGLRTRERVHITEGLRPGEQVIVAGLQDLRDGTRVNLLETAQ